MRSERRPTAQHRAGPGRLDGFWVWDDALERLEALGHRARTLSLPGLEPGTTAERAAAVKLADHVDATCELVRATGPDPLVLVGHSYSGVVVGQVADRLPDLVHRSVHVGSFLPRDGRSLLDDWGDDEQARAEEKAQIVHDGMLWAPPPAAALAMEPDLEATRRQWLLDRFVAHPGRTVLDPATMTRPITEQPVTFVATAPTGTDPRSDLPVELTSRLPGLWRLATLSGGHWPMVTVPGQLATIIHEDVQSLPEQAAR